MNCCGPRAGSDQVPTGSPFIHTARERARAGLPITTRRARRWSPGVVPPVKVERGEDLQEAIHGIATRLQFELRHSGLAGSTGLHTELLLTQISLPSGPSEE